jgi:hypothetical protein
MLAERYLYIFGTRATMKRWKHRPPIRKGTAQNPTAQHTEGNNSAPEDDKDEVATHLTQIPWAETDTSTHTHTTSTSSPAASIFGQHNAHQRTSLFILCQSTPEQQLRFNLGFGFGAGQTTPCHQSIFGRNSPVTLITELDQQQSLCQSSPANKKAPPAPVIETASPRSTPIVPTRKSGPPTPPPAPARTRSSNPPCNAKAKKTARAA